MSRIWSVLLTAVLGVSLVVAVPDSGSAAVERDNFGLVDPTTGIWHLYSGDQETFQFYFGNPGDYPFMGDWDCDGIDTPGLYRQSDGYVYLRNSNTQGIANISFYFGNPGDVPIAGDFNADGCDTVSIYRPSNQRFYIINTLGTNDGGLGAADYSFIFGNPGDKPFIGDFNGNGQDTIGLHRESTGLVYFRNTNTQGIADNQFIYGNPGDRIVAGDWNSNGVDSPAIFRPGNTTMYLRYANSQGNADESWMVGSTSWIPVAGNFGSPEAYLIGLDPVAGGPGKSGPAELLGRTYADSFWETASWNSKTQDTTYLLSGLYDRLTAVAGVEDGAVNSDAEFIIQLYNAVSEEQLWSGTVSVGSTLPVSVDVSGVLRLKVRVIQQKGRAFSDYAVLADAKVGGPGLAVPKGSPLPPAPSSGMFLIGLDPVAGGPGKSGPAELLGRTYADSFWETASWNSKTQDTTYLLSGLYDRLTAVAGVEDGAVNSDAEFIIQLYNAVSEEQLWSGTVSVGSTLPVSVDVSGVLRLKVRVIQQKGRAFSDYAVLADAKVGGPGLAVP